jgi:hypothetical protein
LRAKSSNAESQHLPPQRLWSKEEFSMLEQLTRGRAA